MVQIQADWGSIDSWQEMEPIPAGEYSAKIISQENQTTRSGSTQLVMAFEIIEGAYTGRKVFDRLSLWNEPDKGKNIALSRIKKMAEVTAKQRGQNAFQDTNEFNGIPMNIKVDVEPPSQGYNKPTNKIGNFMEYRSTMVPDSWGGGAPAANPATTSPETTNNTPTSTNTDATGAQPQPVGVGAGDAKAPWES